MTIAHLPAHPQDRPVTTLEQIDQDIRQAIGRIMSGKPADGDYGLVSYLSSERARRLQGVSAAAFERIERMLEDAEDATDLAHRQAIMDQGIGPV